MILTVSLSLRPAAGGATLSSSHNALVDMTTGPGLRTILPPRYPAELAPISKRNPCGTAGRFWSEPGSARKVSDRNATTPTIVQTTNWTRSGTTTPPTVSRSAQPGCTLPAPFDPTADVMPVATTEV